MSRRLDIKYTKSVSSNPREELLDKYYAEYLNKYGKRFSSGQRYRKYAVIDVNEVHTITKTKIVGGQAGETIVSHMVQLGGPFEEVGGKDEIVGSTDQALGSDVK